MHRLTLALRLHVGLIPSSDDVWFVRQIDLPFTPSNGLILSQRIGPTMDDFVDFQIERLHYFDGINWLGVKGFVSFKVDDGSFHVPKAKREEWVAEQIAYYLSKGWENLDGWDPPV